MINPPPNHPAIMMAPHESLIPNPRNPRKHSKQQIAQIAGSIERFGFIVPVIIDDQRQIVAGHGRWEAANLLKLTHVPAIPVAFVSEADRRAFALAENRLAELADWDAELLGEELTWLFESDYDLDVTGFSLADLDFAIGEAGTDEPEQVELPAADAVAISRPGDLWHIGPHRLLCGDARLAESYEQLLGEDRANMVFADPPYNVPIAGHVSGLGKVKHREFVQASGEMTAPEFTTFLRAIFRQLVRFSTASSIHYQCMDWRHMREMLDASDGVYAELKQLVVWNKDVGAMGTFYRSQYELIFVFKAGKGRHINNFGLGEKGRYRTNLWTHPGANSFRAGRARDLADHPTVKPTTLVAEAILDCSNRGDLILDPFSGSGTTLIAAHKTGRRGAAIELDPLYVDTSLRRLCAASGLKAIHADAHRRPLPSSFHLRRRLYLHLSTSPESVLQTISDMN